MRMMRLSILFFMAGLGGCASNDRAPAPETPADPSSVQTQPIQDRLGELKRQRITPGDCGLYLFSGFNRRLVAVVHSGSADILLNLDGKEQRFARTMAEGEPFFGQFTEQVFEGQDIRFSLLVRPDPDTAVINGAVVREGRLVLEDGDGFRFVTPVGGAVACEPG